MAAAAGGAPLAPVRAVGLPQAEAEAIRDTVDGKPIPNLEWAVVETLTCQWTTAKLGSGGFGDVFKGTQS